LASHQVLGHQRAVDPWQDMVVKGIDFPKSRSHLSHLYLEPGWQGGERQVAFFQGDTLFSKSQEEIGARIRIDDFLETDFAFVHFERWSKPGAWVARVTDEIADDTDIRIEHLGRGRTRATELRAAGRNGGLLGRERRGRRC